MKTGLATLAVVACIAAACAGCGSASGKVPSLAATPTPTVEALERTAEDKLMAFTQCVRDHGVDIMDPVVDSDGNVQAPTLADGVELTRQEWQRLYEACGDHIEGISLERERQDLSAQLDKMVAVASCLRSKGYEVDDPTAETIDEWLIDFRLDFDWDDPGAKAAYEDCSTLD